MPACRLPPNIENRKVEYCELSGFAFARSMACLAAIFAMVSSSCLSASSRVFAWKAPATPDSRRST